MDSWRPLRSGQGYLLSSQSMPSFSSPYYANGLPALESSALFKDLDDEDGGDPSPSKKRKTKTVTKRIKKETSSVVNGNPKGQSPASPVKDVMSTFVEGLRYLTLEAANDKANDRVKLLNDTDDDLSDVEREAHHYVLNLVRAFTVSAVDEPTEHRLDPTALTSWHQYQAAHVDKVSRYAATQEDLIEICAWKMYGIVIDIHLNGLPRLNNIPLDRKSKCSERLEAITRSIANYAIVRYDVLRLVKMNELAASPYNYISRKITNWKNNEHKARRDQENADAAARTGTAYRKVLGDHSRTHGAVTNKKLVVTRTSPPVTPPRLIKLETSFSSQDEPHTPFAQTSPAPSSATKRKLIDESAGELYLPSYFDPFADFGDIDPVLR